MTASLGLAYGGAMTTPAEIPTFPIIGWDIGRQRSEGRVLLRIVYLAAPDDPDPHAALMHSMSATQATELALELIHEAANAAMGVEIATEYRTRRRIRRPPR